MGRPRKFESAADRQKAYLERKAQTEQPEKPAPAKVPLKHGERPTTGQSPKTKATPVEASIEEEIQAGEQAYVDEALVQTWLTLQHIHAPQKTTPEAVKERLKRAENYARKRYQGYLAGEVASL